MGMNTKLPNLSNKTGLAIQNLLEKLSREYQLSIEELSTSTITIKDGEVTVTKKGKK